jgi:hypothetical protein
MLPTSLTDLDRLFSKKVCNKIERGLNFLMSVRLSWKKCRCWHLLNFPSLALPLQPNNKNTKLGRFFLPAFFCVPKKAWRIIYKAFCTCPERRLSTYNNLIRSTIVNINIYVNRIEDAESLGLIEMEKYVFFCTPPCILFILSLFFLVKLAVKSPSFLSHLS